ncbi:hypothetical protein V3C99_013781, partial [Haemonchus contortus]|uniref:Glycine rich protein n=1 Tax=Haemonchus contortus TaxID=6289 RepID=A0A7I4YT70_HAECO
SATSLNCSVKQFHKPFSHYGLFTMLTIALVILVGLVTTVSSQWGWGGGFGDPFFGGGFGGPFGGPFDGGFGDPFFGGGFGGPFGFGW